MHKITSLSVVLLLISLFLTRQIYASLDDLNLGVGYGGSNVLTISTDSPGEFNYYLYLRTADNSSSSFWIHYTGINNLQRNLHLGCDSGEISATDNPDTGNCIPGGPFVRGSLVAGNDNRFARAKNFTLFCGTVQVINEATTQNLISDLYNNSVKDFLDNGASSTWCPSSSPTSTPTPITKNPTPTTKKLKSTPTPTQKPIITKKVPSPTQTINTATTLTATITPTPNPTISQKIITTSKPENNNSLWIWIASGSALSLLGVIGYLKRNTIKLFLNSLNNKDSTLLAEQIYPTEEIINATPFDEK